MTDLAISAPNLAAFAPTNWKELVLFADMIARSKAVPECYRGDPAAVIYAVQMGAELGLGPGQSLQSIANIEGSLRMWGDTPLAIVQSSGKLEWIKETFNFPEDKETEWWAECEVLRKGDPEGPRLQRYTYDDAVRAGLWARKSSSGKAMPWTTSPKRLMKYRARGFLLRDVFPDVLKGMAIKEEFGTEYDERNVTPREPWQKSGTGNDALREKMAASMGAAGVATTPAPPPLVVDEAVPDFDSMLVAQVQEALEQEAMAREIDAPTYKQIVLDALAGKKLTKVSAVDVWHAIRTWVPPEPAAEPEAPVAEAAPADEPALF